MCQCSKWTTITAAGAAQWLPALHIARGRTRAAGTERDPARVLGQEGHWDIYIYIYIPPNLHQSCHRNVADRAGGLDKALR